VHASDTTVSVLGLRKRKEGGSCLFSQHIIFLPALFPPPIQVTAWGNVVADFQYSPFMIGELASARAMVDASINHPSVIIWAFFNEGQSNSPLSQGAYAGECSFFFHV